MKTTMRYHLAPVWTITVKKTDVLSVSEDVDELKRSHAADSHVKWYNHFRKQLGSVLKSETHTYHATQPFHS